MFLLLTVCFFNLLGVSRMAKFLKGQIARLRVDVQQPPKLRKYMGQDLEVTHNQIFDDGLVDFKPVTSDVALNNVQGGCNYVSSLVLKTNWKIGDRVQINPKIILDQRKDVTAGPSWAAGMNSTLGKTGVVADTNSITGGVRVRLDGDVAWNYLPEDLLPVAVPATPAPAVAPATPAVKVKSEKPAKPKEMTISLRGTSEDLKSILAAARRLDDAEKLKTLNVTRHN
jgi:hypothetical protein